MESKETWIAVLKQLGACYTVLDEIKQRGVGYTARICPGYRGQLGAVLVKFGVIEPPIIPRKDRTKYYDTSWVCWYRVVHFVEAKHVPRRDSKWYYPLPVLDDGIRALAERWKLRRRS